MLFLDDEGPTQVDDDVAWKNHQWEPDLSTSNKNKKKLVQCIVKYRTSAKSEVVLGKDVQE